MRSTWSIFAGLMLCLAAACETQRDGAAANAPDVGAADAVIADEDAPKADVSGLFDTSDDVGAADAGPPDAASADTALGDLLAGTGAAAVDAVDVADGAAAQDAAPPSDTAVPEDVDDAADGGDAHDIADAEDTAATSEPPPDSLNLDALDAGSAPDASAADAAAQDAMDAIDTGPEDAGPLVIEPVDLGKLPAAALVDVTSKFNLPKGAAFAHCVGAGDIDNDGDDDVVLVRTKLPVTMEIVAMRLQKGKVPQYVTSPIDTTKLFATMGCNLVDLNGDGAADLLLGGQSGLAWYENDGTGKFKDVSDKKLPDVLPTMPWSMAPADYDGDGDLDVFIGSGVLPQICSNVSCQYKDNNFGCWVKKLPWLGDASQDRMLRNDGGKLVDVTDAWKVPNTEIYVTTAADYDFDGDGKLDVLVGNDFGGQDMLRAVHAGPKKSFVSVGQAAGVAAYGHAMGWGVGDLDGDGLDDLVNSDIGPLHVWRRVADAKPGQPKYVEMGLKWGIWPLTWATSSWNPLVHDFDHDGDLDVLVGIAVDTVDTYAFTATQNKCSMFQAPAKSTDILLRNDLSDGGTFTAQRLPVSGCPDVAGLAQVLVDLDFDGDYDLVQVRPACNYPFGAVRILRNDIKLKGGAARVRLVGKAGNRHAIGAVLTGKLGNKVVRRTVAGNRGVGSTSTRELHVGLGKIGVLKSAAVTWPDGSMSKLGALGNGLKVVNE